MPLPWSEIAAYLAVQQIDADPWETATVRAMSTAYCEGYASGRSARSFSPISEAETDPQEQARLKAIQIRAAMMGQR